MAAYLKRLISPHSRRGRIMPRWARGQAGRRLPTDWRALAA